MTRYIDAEKAIEVIVDTPSMVGSKYDFNHDVLTALVDREHEIIDLINNNVPSVDVAPVIHAHWVEKVGMQPTGQHGEHYCSVCCGCALRGRPGSGRDIQTKFCPHCGAKMDEEVQ